VVQVKLLLSPEQAAAPETTLRACNRAADRASAVAFGAAVFSRNDLQELVHAELKAEFGLSAQPAVRRWQQRKRAELQAKRTRSGNRGLARRAKKDAWHATHINHKIAKTIVADAQRTGRGIALEGRAQRARSL
jgi:hypothetical protein